MAVLSPGGGENRDPGDAAPPTGGVGVVWWPPLDPLCQPSEGLVAVVEAEPEAFWVRRARRPSGFSSLLPAAIEHLPQPKLLHGVGAPFGGILGPAAGHQDTLASDVDALRPLWVSDHLSFSRFVRQTPDPRGGPVCAGFLLPPSQTQAGVANAARNVRHRRETLGVPVAFETPVSYLPPAPGEMPDGAYAAAVAEEADCGILLDLHNLLCNERNGRQAVQEFCRMIPLDRVWEVHVAGGQMERGFALDAHSGLVEPALMNIAAELVPHLPALRAMIFEIMPDFIPLVGLSAIADQLCRLNDIWSQRPRLERLLPRGLEACCPASSENLASQRAATPEAWEDAVGAAVAGMNGIGFPPELERWADTAAPAISLYRHLVEESRASSLVFTAPRTIRLLLHGAGASRTRRILSDFWGRVPPAYTGVEEAEAFLDFMSSAGLDVPGLGEAMLQDRSMLRGLEPADPVAAPQPTS